MAIGEWASAGAGASLSFCAPLLLQSDSTKPSRNGQRLHPTPALGGETAAARWYRAVKYTKLAMRHGAAPLALCEKIAGTVLSSLHSICPHYG